jgi:hypothetical protein
VGADMEVFDMQNACGLIEEPVVQQDGSQNSPFRFGAVRKSLLESYVWSCHADRSVRTRLPY